MRIDGSPIILVVLEAGGTWPTWVRSQDSADVMVVAQPRQLEPAQFGEIVAKRLQALERLGRRAASVVIGVTERDSEEAHAARWRIGRALVEHLRQAAGGRILLARGGSASSEERSRLLELTSAIIREANDGRVTSGVRFLEDAFTDRSATVPVTAPSAA